MDLGFPGVWRQDFCVLVLPSCSAHSVFLLKSWYKVPDLKMKQHLKIERKKCTQTNSLCIINFDCQVTQFLKSRTSSLFPPNLLGGHHGSYILVTEPVLYYLDYHNTWSPQLNLKLQTETSESGHLTDKLILLFPTTSPQLSGCKNLLQGHGLGVALFPHYRLTTSF